MSDCLPERSMRLSRACFCASVLKGHPDATWERQEGKGAIIRNVEEPSDGLAPSAPSLPTRARRCSTPATGSVSSLKDAGLRLPVEEVVRNVNRFLRGWPDTSATGSSAHAFDLALVRKGLTDCEVKPVVRASRSLGASPRRRWPLRTLGTGLSHREGGCSGNAGWDETDPETADKETQEQNCADRQHAGKHHG